MRACSILDARLLIDALRSPRKRLAGPAPRPEPVLHADPIDARVEQAREGVQGSEARHQCAFGNGGAWKSPHAFAAHSCASIGSEHSQRDNDRCTTLPSSPPAPRSSPLLLAEPPRRA